MDTCAVGVAYTSVTHFQIRTAFQANKDGGNTLQPWRRPSQSLSWEVVDVEGMVKTGNRALRLRTASEAATSANLKRPVRVRLYPGAPHFEPAFSWRTDIDMCHHFLVCNDVLQHLRERPGGHIDSVRMS